MMIINGLIYTMEGPVYDRGWVLLENGLIISAGPMEALPEYSGERFDAQGGWVLPGLIDAHCHLGMIESIIGAPGNDLNEQTDPCTPQLRSIDAINPMDPAFQEALEAGITAVVTGPGSANPISGQALAIKTWGNRVDDMILRSPASMKFALGENPKSIYQGKSQGPMTRMAVAAVIREALFRAKDYMDRLDRGENPEFDMKLQSLAPLLKRQIPAHFHAHRADDIYTAIRIAREFDLDYVVVHGTDGHLIAEDLKRENVRVITGPSINDRCKPELGNLSLQTPGVLANCGVLCAICTDYPETPFYCLTLSAALAVKNGMGFDEALRAITINGAVIAGIDSRVGSIRPGKDGDLAVFTQNPLDIQSKISAVFVGGRRVV